MGPAETRLLAARTAAVRTAPAWLAWNLAITTFLGAFLLFQVQPLIGKTILPWFGGGPAVWTTCLVFFQIVLFLGYVYTHVIETYVATRMRQLVHIALIVAAIAMLPIQPSPRWKADPGSDPAGRILLLLAASVGLPYFVLSTTGPLAQAWFGRAMPGKSPYRLYALSNVGSLACADQLPDLVRAHVRREGARHAWSATFVLFAVACALAAVWSGARSEPYRTDGAGGGGRRAE